MAAAFNKETGELRVLDKGGQWIAPTMATNPQTGEKLYLEGEDWKPVPLTNSEYGAGAATAVLQGPAMGYGDEYVAALENPSEAVGMVQRNFTPGGIAAQAASWLTGEKLPEVATPGYDKSLKKFRDTENRFRQAEGPTAFGLTAGAGLLGGGYQLGKSAFNLVSRVLPNVGRVGQAAVTGAGFGGVAGFGSGEGGAGERAKSAATGATLGAVVGAGAEVALPALASLVQRFRGNPALWNEAAGRPTAAGIREMDAAGIDRQQASAALQQEFAGQAQNALRPAEAAATAEARSLPVPVQLRRGQQSLDPDQQMFESQAGKGVYGQLAGETIRGSEQAQQEALRANVPAIAERIGGGTRRVNELGQGVAQAQRTLVTAADASRRRVGQLYDAARATNGEAFILGRNVGEGIVGIKQGLDGEGLTADVASRVHRIIDKAAGDLGDVTAAVGREPNISVGNLFTVRQQLSALSRSSDTVEATAAGHAKRSLDRWLNNAIDEDLISGDPAVVELWRRAIGARRQHASQFQAGDFVEKLVQRVPGGSAELKLDPQAAVNLIFGRGDTGFTTQGGMVRGLVRMRTLLGENSPAWNGLREEAFLRMARAGEGATGPTGREFSGANFAKEWETSLAKSPGTMRLLFSDEERNLISQFARVARRTTTNVKGGNNTSNTSAGAAQVMRKMFMSAFMGPKMAAFLESVPIVRGLQNIGQEMRAQNATLGRIQQGFRPQATPQGVNRAVEAGTGQAASALVQQVFGAP